MKMLEETKQIVKALVIPHPNGVGLKTLCEEYQEIEGFFNHLSLCFVITHLSITIF